MAKVNLGALRIEICRVQLVQDGLWFESYDFNRSESVRGIRLGVVHDLNGLGHPLPRLTTKSK